MSYPIDPTVWNEGAAPGISAEELNRIEQGIVDAHNDERDFLRLEAASQTITTSWATYASAIVSIPVTWNQWKLKGWASWVVFGPGGAAGQYQARVEIDGIVFGAMDFNLLTNGTSPGSTFGRKNNVTTQGLPVLLQARQIEGGTALNIRQIVLYADAKRTG